MVGYLIPSIVVLSALQDPWWKVSVACFAEKGCPPNEEGCKRLIYELVDGFVANERSKLPQE